MKSLLLCVLSLLAYASAYRITPEPEPVFTPSLTQTEAASRGPGLKEFYGYANVRQHVFLYYELHHIRYGRDISKNPLVVYLEGGPGLTGSGHSNYLEVGPIDEAGNPRLTTWVNNASLVFVDSPALSGFSFVTNSSAFSVENEQVAEDLAVLVELLLAQTTKLKKSPLHVAGHSYGGKIAPVLMRILYEKRASKTLDANLKGVILVAPYLDPVILSQTYAPLLRDLGWLSEAEFLKSDPFGSAVKLAAKEGKYTEAAFVLFQQTFLILNFTQGRLDGHNFNKQLDGPTTEPFSGALLLQDRLDAIAKNRSLPVEKWNPLGAQMDFLHVPVLAQNTRSRVDSLANCVKIHIMQGRVDVLANAKALLEFLNTLRESTRNALNTATRKQILDPQTNKVEAFVQSTNDIDLYTVFDGGHILLRDQPEVTQRIFLKVIEATYDDVDVIKDIKEIYNPYYLFDVFSLYE